MKSITSIFTRNSKLLTHTQISQPNTQHLTFTEIETI